MWGVRPVLDGHDDDEVTVVGRLERPVGDAEPLPVRCLVLVAPVGAVAIGPAFAVVGGLDLERRLRSHRRNLTLGTQTARDRPRRQSEQSAQDRPSLHTCHSGTGQ
ncbi:hypothetical protein BRD06_10605 [Halobacteriales archaeon QS_9_67_15]|nr:MAG: hypothetical protein BRD06_10605 [Halobacteriales archaeon QS_9_67_15]